MELVSTEELQRRIEHYLGRALVEPVTIISNGKERLVMMSVKEYRRLKRRDRWVMTLDDFTEEDLEAIRNVKAAMEAGAFNHELGGVNMASDRAAVIREDRDARGDAGGIDTPALDEAIRKAQELVRRYVPDDVSLVDELREERQKDAAIALAEDDGERMAGTRPDFKEYLRRPVGIDELDLARDESLGRKE